ncbi:hypothetical protein [Coralliovum pocilloporae]|uniref:hypothetical protein n=1 Tax=Coralliovum pocilloporae TaxID=3066369 RepID=UPI003306BBE6
MIQDKPANPCIRTKINRWHSPLSDQVFYLLENLRTRMIKTEDFQTRLHQLLFNTDIEAEFSEAMEEASTADDQVWLLRRHVDGCRYTVIVYRVDEGEVHPPHQHHNLISTQIILRGQIHLREYDRLARTSNGIQLRLARDAVLGEGETFQASEWSRNAHWFCAHNGPALVFNINARGYEAETFDPTDDGSFGRRYLDPTQFSERGHINAEELDREDAENRFQGKLLSDFPIPDHAFMNR